MSPILDKTSESHPKLTLSKAFSASKVMMSWSPPGLHLACSRTIITLRMFRVAVLPFTKPDWAGYIREGMMVASLEAIFFDKILTSRFKSDMGR